MKEENIKTDFTFLWIMLYILALQSIAPITFDDSFNPEYDFSYQNILLLFKQLTFPTTNHFNIYETKEFLSPWFIGIFSPLLFLNFGCFYLFFNLLILISLPLSVLIISKKLNLMSLAPLFIMISFGHPSFRAIRLNPSDDILGFLALALTLHYISKPILSGFLLAAAVLFEPLIFLTLPLFLVSRQYKILCCTMVGLLLVFLTSPLVWITFFKTYFPNVSNDFFAGQYGFNYTFALLGALVSENGYAKGFEFGLLLYISAYFTLLTAIFAKKDFQTDDDKIIPILLSIPFVISVPGFAKYETYCAVSLMLPLIISAQKKGFACYLCLYAFAGIYLLSAVNIVKTASIIPNIIITTIPQIGVNLLCFLSCAFAIRWVKYLKKT